MALNIQFVQDPLKAQQRMMQGARPEALELLQQMAGLTPQAGPLRPGEALPMLQEQDPALLQQQQLQALPGLLANPLTQDGAKQLQQQLQQQQMPQQQQQQDPTSLMKNFAFLQSLQQQSPEMASQFESLLTKPSTQVNIGDKPGNVLTPEAATRMGLDPNETWWLDPQKGPKKLSNVTEGQRAASGFASRMVESGQIIDNLERAGGFDPSSIAQHSDKFVPQLLSNFIRSPAGQAYSAASMNWVRANLRKESGAVIGEEEMKNEIITYFPQPGDTKETIKQKSQARKLAERSVSAQGGEFFKKAYSGTLNAPIDPSGRIKGMMYKTPKGVLKWTGKGWVKP